MYILLRKYKKKIYLVFKLNTCFFNYPFINGLFSLSFWNVWKVGCDESLLSAPIELVSRDSSRDFLVIIYLEVGRSSERGNA